MFGDQTPRSKPQQHQQQQQPLQSFKHSPEVAEKVPKKLGQDAATQPSSATQSPLLLPKAIGTGERPLLVILPLVEFSRCGQKMIWVWSEA